MSSTEIGLLKTTHEGPHPEEDIYGTDYILVFGAGEIDDPANYKAAIVTARVHPVRGSTHKATLNALWSFPRIDEPREALVIDSAVPVEIEQIELAASGMMKSIETRSQDEIEAAHQRYKQAVLRNEG